MRLSPRYDGPPIIVIAGDSRDVGGPLVRQRNRLATTLSGLTDAQWAHPTRCEGWRVQDVVAHLAETNRFWAYSIHAGLAGEPTRLLASFDPVSNPAQSVHAVRDLSPTEVLERFVRTNRALADAVDGLDVTGWSTLAESPPGHVSIRAVAHHALWDGWVHERDIALPLGMTPVHEPDEVLACLCYAAALSPAFAVTTDATRRGVFEVTATDPDAHLVVTIDGNVTVQVSTSPQEVVESEAVTLSGPAVDLIEMLSMRVPLTATVTADQLWLFAGLATVFDSEVTLAPSPS